MGTRSVFLGLATGIGIASGAWAQTVLHTYSETEAGAMAGTSVAIWEDVNQDGYLDWVAGVPIGDGVGTNTGLVHVFSGTDNSVLLTFEGPAQASRFGHCTANVGDLNGDGLDELGVGAIGEAKVYIYSGATSALMWTAQGPANSGLGWSIAAAGDVNADGIQDVAVGIQPNSAGAALRVYSGNTGSLVYQVAGTATSVAGLGDVNGDGFDDVLVGQGVAFSHGGAKVLAGPLGTQLYSLQFGQGTAGYSVAAMGDLDNDGITDFAVGDPTEALLGGAPGVCTVHSGADGTLLWSQGTLEVNQFGAAVANAGDVDGDGFDDLLVGNGTYHEVSLFSVARDVELLVLDIDPINHFGVRVAGGKDVDGDGYLDFIGGGGRTIYAQHPNDPSGAVLFTAGCWPGAAYNYCDAVANSTGQRARMNWQNTTSVSTNNFRLSAIKCPANKPGLFFYGSSQTNLPVGDGHLCVSGGLNRLAVVSTGSTGTPSMTLDFTNPPHSRRPDLGGRDLVLLVLVPRSTRRARGIQLCGRLANDVLPVIRPIRRGLLGAGRQRAAPGFSRS